MARVVIILEDDVTEYGDPKVNLTLAGELLAKIGRLNAGSNKRCGGNYESMSNIIASLTPAEYQAVDVFGYLKTTYGKISRDTNKAESNGQNIEDGPQAG